MVVDNSLASYYKNQKKYSSPIRWVLVLLVVAIVAVDSIRNWNIFLHYYFHRLVVEFQQRKDEEWLQ